MCVCVCVYIDVFLTQPFIVAFDEKERKKTDARRCCLNSRLFFFSLLRFCFILVVGVVAVIGTKPLVSVVLHGFLTISFKLEKKQK